MSPSTDNFIHSLVEMSKAFEELPKVQAELNRMHAQAMVDGNSIAEREATILRLKAEIDSLHAKVRDVEVAKDAAETMFLEADDRTSRALDFIKATFSNAGSLIQALEPPRVELAVEPEVKPTPAAVSVPTDPTSAPIPDFFDLAHQTGSVEDTSASSVASELTNSTIDPLHPPMPYSAVNPPTPDVTYLPDPIAPLPEVAPEPSPSDQSALGFTLPTTVPTSTSAPADTPSENVGPTDENVSTAERSPYQGEYYHKFPNYISLSDWLAGGGNEYSYYYRP